MLTEPGGPFIDVTKINLENYSKRPAPAKVVVYTKYFIYVS